jgi:hypothetical protein
LSTDDHAELQTPALTVREWTQAVEELSRACQQQLLPVDPLVKEQRPWQRTVPHDLIGEPNLDSFGLHIHVDVQSAFRNIHDAHNFIVTYLNIMPLLIRCCRSTADAEYCLAPYAQQIEAIRAYLQQQRHQQMTVADFIFGLSPIIHGKDPRTIHEKYRGMNLQHRHFKPEGTIELRVFHSPATPQGVLFWINFVNRLLDYAASQKEFLELKPVPETVPSFYLEFSKILGEDLSPAPYRTSIWRDLEYHSTFIDRRAADVPERTDSPFAWACKQGQTATVERLLQDPSPRISSVLGMPPLTFAATNGNVSLLWTLLQSRRVGAMKEMDWELLLNSADIQRKIATPPYDATLIHVFESQRAFISSRRLSSMLFAPHFLPFDFASLGKELLARNPLDFPPPTTMALQQLKALNLGAEATLELLILARRLLQGRGSAEEVATVARALRSQRAASALVTCISRLLPQGKSTPQPKDIVLLVNTSPIELESLIAHTLQLLPQTLELEDIFHTRCQTLKLLAQQPEPLRLGLVQGTILLVPPPQDSTSEQSLWSSYRVEALQELLKLSPAERPSLLEMARRLVPQGHGTLRLLALQELAKVQPPSSRGAFVDRALKLSIEGASNVGRCRVAALPFLATLPPSADATLLAPAIRLAPTAIAKAMDTLSRYPEHRRERLVDFALKQAPNGTPQQRFAAITSWA